MRVSAKVDYAIRALAELAVAPPGLVKGGRNLARAGITLAPNVRSSAEVGVLAEADAAGAVIKCPGAPTVWGGYSGVFADPEGHRWEVARNPGWTLAEDGTVHLQVRMPP